MEMVAKKKEKIGSRACSSLSTSVVDAGVRGEDLSLSLSLSLDEN